MISVLLSHIELIFKFRYIKNTFGIERNIHEKDDDVAGYFQETKI
jgi:hypothetical protein